MRGLCFSCSPGSPFLRVHTKRQRLRPQIGRRRCLAFYYRTSNENRRHFSAPHVSVGIRRTAAYASLARQPVHFLRVHTKRQRLRPQIGRRRCLALIIARRMRTGGTFPRPMFRWGSGERQLMLLLLAGQSIFCASIQKGSAFVHKSGGGAALRLFYRTSKEKRWHFSALQVSVGIRRIAVYSPVSPFFAHSYTKSSVLVRNRSEALLCVYFIARRRRKDGTFLRPRFRWGSGESRRIRRLCRGRRAAGGSHARR